jgi:tRNA (adenine57-N1/adenine58-N1)-methyltransferase
MTDHKVKKGDTIVLIPTKTSTGPRLCIKIQGDTQKIPKLGVFKPEELIGTAYGSKLTLGRKSYWILPANSNDQILSLTRKAQIILPKDSMNLIHYCDIKPDSKVVEGGLGSGALTIILLNHVGEKGTVTTYETRSDFIKVGTRNINMTGLADRWKLNHGDITKGISEKSQDAVVLDIPEPWLAVEHAYNSLRPGGIFASYLPTMNQVEQLVNTIREFPFIDLHTYETLQRELEVGPRGTRPSFDMLGHTGYSTVARKVLGE